MLEQIAAAQNPNQSICGHFLAPNIQRSQCAERLGQRAHIQSRLQAVQGRAAMRRVALLYAIAATSAWQPLRPKAITRTKQYVTVPWLPAPRARRRREGTLASAMTKTAKRIFLPTTIISAVAYVAFAPLAQLTHNVLGRRTALLIGNSDLAKTVPGVLGLLFSVVPSNPFTALYEQQEAAHLAVYAEVSCARSLLEQLVLVLGGPGEPRCRSALRAFRRYVGDLEQDVGDPRRGPAKRLTIGAPVQLRRPFFFVSRRRRAWTPSTLTACELACRADAVDAPS